MKESKNIIANNFIVFMFEVQAAIQEGWEIDKDSPPIMYGNGYETGVVRTPSKAREMAERILNDNPKMTRAEILEKARAAKKQGG